MNNNPKQPKDWKEEFEKRFVVRNLERSINGRPNPHEGCVRGVKAELIFSFIESLLAEEYQKGYDAFSGSMKNVRQETRAEAIRENDEKWLASMSEVKIEIRNRAIREAIAIMQGEDQDDNGMINLHHFLDGLRSLLPPETQEPKA